MWPAGDVLIKFLTNNSENTKNSSLLNVQPDVQLLEWGAENEIHLEKIFQSKPLGNDYNLILGSDLTYHSSSAPKLFWTVTELLRRLSRRKEKCMHGESKERSDDVKFLTAHEHRLDHSTREVLKVAVDQYSLQHEELYRTPDKKHSIWQFTYPR